MKKNRYFGRFALTLLAAFFALWFLMPTVLTITNSFMTQSEISANYGKVFANVSGSDGKAYIADEVNLKFIPDKVSLSQYITTLIKSPDYLLKFWNSVILTVPVVLLQLAVASVTAYGFTRWRGKVRSLLFFFYVILMLMPTQVTLVPNYLVSDWIGILNTRWAIILPGAFAPFSVFLLTKSMRRIPASLIEAAKLAGAHSFISEFPDGYDTYVGERGVRLSGGQKQRVAIARALIHDRSILLVDEGTSALDQKNADIVEKSLLSNPDLTLILVSHHLTEERQKQFDRVYRL